VNKTLSQITDLLKSEYLSLLFRYGVGVYFIYASMSKFPLPAQFAENVANFRIVPYWTVNFIAVLLPWAEMVGGLFLILGLRTRAAASILALLLVVFTIGVAINVVRGSPITCGCTDTVGEPVSWWKVTKNTGVILLTLHVFFFDRLLLLRMGGMFRKRLRRA